MKNARIGKEKRKDMSRKRSKYKRKECPQGGEKINALQERQRGYHVNRTGVEKVVFKELINVKYVGKGEASNEMS